MFQWLDSRPTQARQELLQIQMQRGGVSRRRLLQFAAAGAMGAGAGLFRNMASYADDVLRSGKSCIMIFLQGAPSQLETWDPKPGTANGGPTTAIDTRIPGVRFAQYWPLLAQATNDVSVIRTIAGKEAAHERGQFHLRTGRRLGAASDFPHIGSIAASEIGNPAADMPNFVSIGSTIGAGFLGVNYAPFVVDQAGQLPANVQALVQGPRSDRRLELLREQDRDFGLAGAEDIASEHEALYDRARRMMTSPHLNAFEITSESDAVKAAYGTNAFGNGCLVARRLIEAGTPFVEVQRGGWDMHDSLWQRIEPTAAEVDKGVSQLISDLKQRGLLGSTLVLVLGEFGRTPKINQRTPQVGRDHWARNFGMLLAGCGIAGGRCVGSTSDNGEEITDSPVEVDDIFATICECLGIDPYKELYTPEGRPLRIVDEGVALSQLMA